MSEETRVGAILGIDEKKQIVRFLGYGIFQGCETEVQQVAPDIPLLVEDLTKIRDFSVEKMDAFIKQIDL